MLAQFRRLFPIAPERSLLPYQYEYFYAYMPRAKVVQEGGAYVLKVEGMARSVVVKPA